jgi:RNA 2',3'-cyclic 3'-phosphodiesterase
MLRLFVGIALPPEVKLRLSIMTGGLPGAKWVDSGNLHLTLRFIGEVDEGLAGDIDAALLQIRVSAFELELAGVGQFGAGEKTRALWVGVERNERLMQLRDKVEHALMRVGVEPETRKYAPHVTLARFKYVHAARVQEFIQRHALFRAPPFRVGHFSLIASYLTKGGPIYEDQADYALA